MTNPYIINFQNIDSDTGVLNIFEVQNQINFDIKRVFILNEINENVIRGNHAHKETQQLLICLSVQIEIFTEMPNGDTFNFILNNSRVGLFLPPQAWHYRKYLKGTIQMVCASQKYDEYDYLRSRMDFKEYYK